MHKHPKRKNKFSYFVESEFRPMMPFTDGSLCLFAVYEDPNIDMTFDDDTKRYVKTLSRAFDSVWVLTNERSHRIHPQEFPETNIKIWCMPNLCHDFGMWFRVLYHLLDANKPSRLALINHSAKLLNPDKLLHIFSQQKTAEFWGLSDSIEDDVHHIQSYFLVFDSPKAITTLHAFVKHSNIHQYVKASKLDIIRNFELGMSKYMNAYNIKPFAVFSYQNLGNYPSKWDSQGKNPSFHLWDRLLQAGCPVLKKRRVVFPNEDEFIAQFLT